MSVLKFISFSHCLLVITSKISHLKLTFYECEIKTTCTTYNLYHDNFQWYTLTTLFLECCYVCHFDAASSGCKQVLLRKDKWMSNTSTITSSRTFRPIKLADIHVFGTRNIIIFHTHYNVCTTTTAIIWVFSVSAKQFVCNKIWWLS